MHNKNIEFHHLLMEKLGYSSQEAADLAKVPLPVMLAEALKAIEPKHWEFLIERRRSLLATQINSYGVEADIILATFNQKRDNVISALKQLEAGTKPLTPLREQLSAPNWQKYLELKAIAESLEEGGTLYIELAQQYEAVQEQLNVSRRKAQELEMLFDDTFVEIVRAFTVTLIQLSEILSADSELLSRALVTLFGPLLTREEASTDSDSDLSLLLELALNRQHVLPTEPEVTAVAVMSMDTTQLPSSGDDEENVDLPSDDDKQHVEVGGTLNSDELETIFRNALETQQEHNLRAIPEWIIELYDGPQVVYNFVVQSLYAREPQLIQVTERIHTHLNLSGKQKFVSRLLLINSLTPSQLTDIAILRKKRNLLETSPLEFAFNVKLWFAGLPVNPQLSSTMAILISYNFETYSGVNFEELVSLAEQKLPPSTSKTASSDQPANPISPKASPVAPPTLLIRHEGGHGEGTSQATSWDELHFDDQARLTDYGVTAEEWNTMPVGAQSTLIVEVYSGQKDDEEIEDETLGDELIAYPEEINLEPAVIIQCVQAAHARVQMTIAKLNIRINYSQPLSGGLLDKVSRGKAKQYQDEIDQLRLKISVSDQTSGYALALLVEIFRHASSKKARWRSRNDFKPFIKAFVDEAISLENKLREE